MKLFGESAEKSRDHDGELIERITKCISLLVS
jgi:hypothetical protein